MWFDATESQLGRAEEQIRHVGELLTKYGRDIQMVGGGDSGSRFVPERGIMG